MVKETDKTVKKKVASKKGSKGAKEETNKAAAKKTTTKKTVKTEVPKKVVKKKPRVIMDDGKVILDKKAKFKEKTIIMKPITEDMAKEKKKETKLEKTKANNQFEIIVCVVVGLVFLALLFGAINSYIFIPAAMISFALELFCICYHLVDRPNRKTEVYTLFIVGVIFVFFAIVYTIVKTS